jgi:GTP cyclohydrolase I
VTPQLALAEADDLARLRRRIHAEEPGAIDLDRASFAAAEMLIALGVDLRQPGLAETPDRLVGAYAELLEASPFDFTTFENAEAYDELVMVEDIPVRSLCEHHMLPFVGVAHIGYLPDDRVLGLSKFARMVDFYGRRPQTQERLTKQVAERLQAELAPRGVGVVIEAEHTCMTLRGARAVGARTVTSALVGHLRDDPAARAEFLALARKDRP